ncbi:MAG: nicotinate phosphoribosyltransferase [Gemmataceae bacterium]|nr:nicotinate phosphoribosyltransferase [Gemmataceae bacterium]MCS7269898.1 nicotinate phosphoribosyltransferase [Gemmataceae bacterium]MDW8243844.1 nicotinate phosphoribosyltransferase [Thermogemmata sp.]
MTGRCPPSLATFTDLYELTMAQAYWREGLTAEATFSFFFRSLPPQRGYLVAAGIDQVVTELEQFHFTTDDIAELQRLQRFDEDFLRYLSGWRFRGTVRAVAEGTLVFAHEPLLEVTAPIIEAQVVETLVVNRLHLHTLLASKAARVRWAAGPHRQVIDFGARRCHGLEAAQAAARCGWLVGFDGTSNVMAGLRYGIPLYGTMAHSFVTAFADELAAFRAYARTFPDSTTLLVDTYDTVEGIKHALRVAAELSQQGHQLRGIRLDSGDLLTLSRIARELADAAGFPQLQIFVSGGIDEYAIEQLVRQQAPVDAFGVGTKVGVSQDAPYGDCAYKLVAYNGQPRLKLSEHKQTLPAAKQVYRFYDAAGQMLYDQIALADEPSPPGGQPLLHEVMRQGQRVVPPPTLEQSRQYFRQHWAGLPPVCKDLHQPAPYDVQLSVALHQLTQKLVAHWGHRLETPRHQG